MGTNTHTCHTIRSFLSGNKLLRPDPPVSLSPYPHGVLLLSVLRYTPRVIYSPISFPLLMALVSVKSGSGLLVFNVTLTRSTVMD